MVVTVWLATWSGKSPEEQKRSYYIEVMAALVAAAIVVSLLRSVLAFSSLVKVITYEAHSVFAFFFCKNNVLTAQGCRYHAFLFHEVETGATVF